MVWQKLSKAELLVVKSLCKGKSNHEMADDICIAEKTVRFHLSRIYKKLELPHARAVIAKVLKDWPNILEEK